MNIPCCVIKDLLPLYVEKINSQETHAIIEEHLFCCDKCKKELEELLTPNELPVDTDIMPLKHVKKVLHRKKVFTILLTIALTLSVLAISIGYMLSPQFIQLSDDMFHFAACRNGTVEVQIISSVADYEISSFYSREMQGEVYYISAWDNTWNKVIKKNKSVVFPLNPSGEPIACVYYSPNDGSQDILIYGDNMFENGGSVTLPRLALTQYLIAAAILTALLGVVIVVFRKNKNVLAVLLRFACLPIAFMISSLCIKGFHTGSYALLHDLFSILLLTVPLYFLLWLVMKRFVLEKNI